MSSELFIEKAANFFPSSPLLQITEHVGEFFGISAWKEPLSRIGETISKGRGSSTLVLAIVLDQAIRFQLLEMPANGIGANLIPDC
jgi:hypothetical protein